MEVSIQYDQSVLCSLTLCLHQLQEVDDSEKVSNHHNENMLQYNVSHSIEN